MTGGPFILLGPVFSLAVKFGAELKRLVRLDLAKFSIGTVPYCIVCTVLGGWEPRRLRSAA